MIIASYFAVRFSKKKRAEVTARQARKDLRGLINPSIPSPRILLWPEVRPAIRAGVPRMLHQRGNIVADQPTLQGLIGAVQDTQADQCLLVCGFAWNKDPALGVICIQSGPLG
jgi:hypothetical protein